MAFKASGPGDTPREIDRWDGGVGWIAHPEETIQRASHAVAVDGAVWVIDPVDAAGLDDVLGEFGTVAGVVVTMDRHGRDAGTVAARHDVPVYLPRRVDLDVDAPVTRFDGDLADSGLRAIEVVTWPGWKEAALYDGETLVVGDALGTVDFFCAGDEPLGVHPLLRVAPPRALRGLDPERVLVGHGQGVFADAAAAVDAAVATARRNLPRAWLGALRATI